MNSPAANEPCCPVCGGTHARHAREVAGFALWRCEGCQLVYVWPRPAREASASSYAAGRQGNIGPGGAAADAATLLAAYDAAHTPYVQLGLRRRLARLHRRRALGRVLDFGCGSGHLLGLAREAFGSAIWGIELHPVARAGAARFGFTLHAGPLESAPFPPGSFDLVYSVQVFEHLPEPRVEVARLVQLLAPGGLLFLEVPHEGSLAIRLGRDRFLYNRPPGHLNYFTRAAMGRLLEDAGLGILSLRTTGLDHRSLLGRSAGASGGPPAAGKDPSHAPVETPPPAWAIRARLQLLGLLDGVLGLPGWGMQLEAVARRPA